VIRNDLPVMILAGGLGTRLREETEFRPKPMVPVGGKPILWHIMKNYAAFGFYRFIICLGYKGEMIKDYFLNYRYHDVDLTINTSTGLVTEHQAHDEAWEITLVDTGLDCLTGGRIARAAKYVDTERFLLTYGDGLADININSLLNFHLAHGKLVTLSGVSLPSRFGNLQLNENVVTAFLEKESNNKDWINGGFFVLEKTALTYISNSSSCTFEQEPLKNLAADAQLMMYKHQGFWHCMDTQRDHQKLEELWKTSAPWKMWSDLDRYSSSFLDDKKIDIHHTPRSTEKGNEDGI